LKVYFDFSDYHLQRPVITSGVFDGVHKGHVEILNTLKRAAEARQGESVVVTFWPHPKLVVHSGYTLKLINTLDEKLSLLEKNGIEHVVVIPFTEEFANYSATEYVQSILVEKLRVLHLIMGFNHHFGKGREGNFESMLEFGKTFGFTVEKLDAQLIENEKVSSTLIRHALDAGDVEAAYKYLGYHYHITGKVEKGQQLGRSIGFPTVNLKINQPYKLTPRDGVYAVEVLVDGTSFAGMLNMGFRPTVDRNLTHTIEAHLIDFNGDLYDKNITLRFIKRIRDEKKFENLEALRQQIEQDKASAKKILGL
jgi:riboflavin kinase/FMN adenylyltransferase